MRTHFEIFGEPVELLVTSQQTSGAFSIGRQTCRPGGGTPPHIHHHEDEVLSVVSGRFEVFNGKSWTEIPPNGTVLVPRGKVHCFRNCGKAEGTIQFVCSGGRFDGFLEGLSGYSFPEDMQAIVDYSANFGIRYPTLPRPSPAVPPARHAERMEAVDWAR